MEVIISHSSFIISHSSFGRPSIIGRPCKASSYDNNRFMPIKPTTKNIIKSSDFPTKCSTKKLINIPVLRLYDQSRLSKSFSYSQHKRNSIQASAPQVPQSASSNSALAKASRFGSVLYEFLRPYAIYQVVLSTTCLFARVFVENPQLFKWSLMFKAFPGLISIVLATVYNIGLNDIYDAEIDRINKPYLPIPSGDLSIKQAWFLTILSLLAGLWILALMNADLITISIYCLGLFFATFYSAPPIRYKRSSLATSICFPLMSICQDVGTLYATKASLGLPFWWSPPVVFIIIFNALFGVVICITKDLSDVEGDRKYNIRTFASKFGLRNTAFFGTGLLLINYIGAIMATIYMPGAFKSYLMLPAHLIFALWLLFQARKLDKENYSKEASKNFYQFLWKLAKLEFLLFPFI